MSWHHGNQLAATWPEAHSDFLRNNFLRMSMSRMARQLNELYNTTYTRNAVCGRISRMGLGKKPKPIEALPPGGKGGGSRPRPRPPALKPHPPAAPIPDAQEIAPRNLTLIDLGPNECRWPYGEGPFTFCGHPGHPYCPSHDRQSRRPAFGRERMACQ